MTFFFCFSHILQLINFSNWKSRERWRWR